MSFDFFFEKNSFWEIWKISVISYLQMKAICFVFKNWYWSSFKKMRFTSYFTTDNLAFLSFLLPLLRNHRYNSIAQFTVPKAGGERITFNHFVVLPRSCSCRVCEVLLFILVCAVAKLGILFQNLSQLTVWAQWNFIVVCGTYWILMYQYQIKFCHKSL